MANPQIKFYKGASAPTTLTAGMIWFNTKNRTIQVYTGSAWEIYTGLVDATYANNQLTITKAVGEPLVLDFNSMLGSISGLGKRLDDYDTWKAETVTPVITAFNANFATVKAASEANTAKLAGLTKATVKAEITADVAAEAGRVDGLLVTVNKSIEDMGVDVAANKASAADYATFKANHKTTVDGYIDAKVNALGGDKTGSDDYVSVQVTTAKGEVSGVVVNTDALTTKIGSIDLAAGENKTAIEALGKKVGSPVEVEGVSAYSKDYTVGQDVKAAKDAAKEAKDAADAAQQTIDEFLTGEGIDATKIDSLKDILAYIEEHGTEFSEHVEAYNALAELVGEGTVDSRIATAKSEIVAEIEKNEETTAAALTDLNGRVDALEALSAGTEISGIKGRLDTLETEVNTNIPQNIADAKSGAEATAAADATAKANTAESNAKGHADGLIAAEVTRSNKYADDAVAVEAAKVSANTAAIAALDAKVAEGFAWVIFE